MDNLTKTISAGEANSASGQSTAKESDMDRLVDAMMHHLERAYNMENRMYHIMRKLRGDEIEIAVAIKEPSPQMDANEMPYIQRLERHFDELRQTSTKLENFIDGLERVVG